MNYVDALINDTYPIVLPEFRKVFHEERPNWERGRLDSCAERMTRGMVVFDVGAEQGDFTALYRSWVGEEGDVIPIEPAAHYWPFIRETWEANGFPEPPQYAFEGLLGVSERVGDGQACAGVWPDSAYGEGIPDGGFLHLAHADKIRVGTVDHIAEVVTPDVLVIDVEGAEHSVLRGARETLSQHRVLVYVSVHEETMWNWYRTTLNEIKNFMVVLGYTYEELPHHGEGETFWLFRPEGA